MAKFAAGAGGAAVQMPVKIESAAEHLASVDHGEVAHATALAEPSVADQKRPWMMIEQNRQVEPAGKFLAERKAVERGGQINGDNGAAVSIHHTSDGDADAERQPARLGECSPYAGGNGLDDRAASLHVSRQGFLVLRMNLPLESHEGGADGARHEQNAADRLRIRREPQGARWLAAAFSGRNRLALDEELLVE